MSCINAISNFCMDPLFISEEAGARRISRFFLKFIVTSRALFIVAFNQYNGL